MNVCLYLQKHRVHERQIPDHSPLDEGVCNSKGTAYEAEDDVINYVPFAMWNQIQLQVNQTRVMHQLPGG